MNTTPPTPLWDRARHPLDETHAMLEAAEWLDGGAWGLLLLGGVGRGKSQAAAWLWHKLREEAVNVAQAPGLAERAGQVVWLRARALQRLDWGSKATALGVCATAYGLVVDELGAEDERTGQAIGDVLEQRGDDLARTVMTSNLDGAGFLQRYGDRLTSRLRSGGVVDGRARWAVVVQGDDLRSRGAAGGTR